MLARKRSPLHPPNQANPFTSIRLQPLCPPQKSQPQSNQHLPASFSKTPGVGGTPFLATRHSPLATRHSSLATRHSPLDSHTPRPSYSNEPFGKDIEAKVMRDDAIDAPVSNETENTDSCNLRIGTG